MQVTGDPVPVLEHGEALCVPAVLGQLQADARLRGEADQHLHRGRGQRHRAGAAPGGQDPADVAGSPQREHHRRAQVQVLAGDRSHPLVAAEVLQAQRLAAAQHDPRHRAGHRQHQAEGLLRPVARGMLDHQLPAVARGQGQDHQVGAGHLQRLPGHQGQHLVGVRLGQQPLGDLGAGAQPPLLPPCLVIQPGVPDRDARRGRRARPGPPRPRRRTRRRPPSR